MTKNIKEIGEIEVEAKEIIALRNKIDVLEDEFKKMKIIHKDAWEKSGKEKMYEGFLEIQEEKEKEIKDLKALLKKIEKGPFGSDISIYLKNIEKARQIISTKGGEK